MDTARFAAMADPLRNYHFSRGWDEPPPSGRERRPTGGTIGPANYSTHSSTYNDNRTGRLKQLAFEYDRAAEAELCLGHLSAAERLSRMAERVREGGQ